MLIKTTKKERIWDLKVQPFIVAQSKYFWSHPITVAHVCFTQKQTPQICTMFAKYIHNLTNVIVDEEIQLQMIIDSK